MEFKVPSSLKLEHEELHAELAKAILSGGRTGEAAETVARVLHGHFEKEEEFALPPLGLLTRLTKGEITPEMENVLSMTDRLSAEMDQMLEEHKAVVDALKALSDVATEEGKLEFGDFSRKLALHAQTEEDVLYPAAILIGNYLKLKLNIR